MMDVRIDQSLTGLLQIRHATTHMDTDALIFEFKNKPNVAVYSDKSVILIKKEVTILHAMVNAGDQTMGIQFSDDVSVFIKAPAVSIFKDEHGEICFIPAPKLEIKHEVYTKEEWKERCDNEEEVCTKNMD